MTLAAGLETATLVLYFVIGALLGAAALMTLGRMERGPRVLDRIVSLDVFTAILIGGVGLISASTERVDLVPVMLALALTGFFGAVAMARFSSTARRENGQILSPQELQEELDARAAIEDDDDAPAVFDPEEQEETIGRPDSHQETVMERRTSADDERSARQRLTAEREGAIAPGQGEGHEPMEDAPVGSPTKEDG